MNLFNKMMIPAFAAALTIGASVASQAQVNFVDTNIGINFVSIASSNGGATATTSPVAVQVRYPTNSGAGGTEAYQFNSAGTTDAATRDGSGGGAFIRLSQAGQGFREASFQNTVLNTSSVNYNFALTLYDVNNNASSTVLIPFTFNNAFNEGSNGNDSVSNVVLPGPFNIGTDTYILSQFTFTPASAPPTTGGTSPTDGAFSVRVQVVAVPEPGSVAMMVGMGITGAGFLVRRRRK